MRSHDVLIVGAGPAGLAAAIAARQAGLDYTVLEKGALVDSIYRFPTHMVFFTTPELLEIGNLPFVTPYEKPTRLEALRCSRRVTDAFGLQIELGHEVTGIRRSPEGSYVVTARSGRPHRRNPRRGRRDGHRLLRPPEPAGRRGRGPAARQPLLPRRAPLLPEEGHGSRREQFGGRSVAGALSRGR